MLPDGFEWQNRYQYDAQRTALVFGGKQVAMLLQRVDGGWFARLWCHWPITEPTVTRPCSGLEAARAGVEAWAWRHEARIREEVASGRRSIGSGPQHPKHP